MTRLLLWTLAFSIGLAVPCAAGPAEDVAATTKAWMAVNDSRVRVLGDVAVNTGYYTFTAMRNGQPDPRPARFSFTYRLRDGRWLIVDHHSSSVPAAPRQ